MHYNWKSQIEMYLLIRVTKVEVCDARDDDSSTAVGAIKKSRQAAGFNFLRREWDSIRRGGTV